MVLRQIILTIIICGGLMFSCLDTSIVSTALISVSVEFENYQDTPWTVLSYLLAYMSFVVGFSKLSDIYGRKNILAVSWLLFTLGSVWCGIARHMGKLIAGRAVQGLGGSGLYSLAQVCLLEQGPSRPEVAGGLVGITLSISFVLGPLLGGVISEWNWRGIFWFNIPFGVLAVLGIYALWPEDRRNRHSTTATVSKIDFLGNAMLAAASVLLVFAMQEAGSFVWSWSSPVIVWSLVMSGTCWVLLGVWEYCLSHLFAQQIQPIFPMHLLRNRAYALCLLATLLGGFSYISLIIKIPERLQIIHGDNALWAGVHLLPMLGACAFGSFLGGAVSKQANLTSQTLVAGSTLQVLGLALLFGFSTSLGLELDLLLVFTAIYGLGVGLSFAACTMMAAIEAHSDDLAAAQGAVAHARVFGGALGLAVCTIVFNEELQTSLGPGAGSQLGQQGLDQIHRNLLTVLSLPDAARLEVIGVYLDAFTDQVFIMVIVAVVALFSSLGTYRSRASNPVDVMLQLKEGDRSGARGDLELSSVSSTRSLVR
ncbi:major facilitator superfamily domain-containing protein [Chaetomium strumarium]|uniref:Major facilitator superfamily domain-containing protein n=1 Tax=Chaetomium strumarium TaxID=1170767 RepID=A0AAJ0M6G5_9PEZI|nr:major facilitator superfamily domain-containing protein [Chaetomium strumarium]